MKDMKTLSAFCSFWIQVVFSASCNNTLGPAPSPGPTPYWPGCASLNQSQPRHCFSQLTLHFLLSLTSLFSHSCVCFILAMFLFPHSTVCFILAMFLFSHSCLSSLTWKSALKTMGSRDVHYSDTERVIAESGSLGWAQNLDWTEIMSLNGRLYCR